MTNFRQHKKAHKKSVGLLLVLFVIACALIVGILELILRYLDSPFPYHYPFVLVVILIGVIYQYYKLKGGGAVVAEDLGARKISNQTRDLDEKRLLNIVEEISIASTLPIPSVYVLEDESINAFVSGISTDDMILCVTRGALSKLNRNELQGVIGHEFTHILNEDVGFNIKMASLIFGLFSLALVGKFFLKHISVSSRTKSSNNKKGSGGMILAMALALVLVGYLGRFIGNILNAAISRQKEFIADAGAVEFTRDSSGIANALKKIGIYSSSISASNAELYNHFYLASGHKSLFSGMFATHPPLNERIKTLEPSWDGSFNIQSKKAKQSNKEKHSNEEKEGLKEKLTKTLTTASAIGSLYGFLATRKVPKKLRVVVDEPLSASAFVLAIIAKSPGEIDQSQLDELLDKRPELYAQTIKAYGELIDAEKSEYLSLLLLCVSSLKQLSKPQYEDFKNLVYNWIEANEKISFYEWLIQRIVIKPLDIYFKLSRPKEDKKSLAQLQKQASSFVSYLCFYEYKETQKAKLAFEKALVKSEVKLEFIAHQRLDFSLIDADLEALLSLEKQQKAKLLHICLLCLNEDGVLSDENKLMLSMLALNFKLSALQG